MVETFDRIKLESSLRRLGTRKACLFGLMVVDRMLPNYMRFSNETQLSGWALLEEAVSGIWRKMDDGSPAAEYPWTPKDCVDLIPESELVGSDYSSSAGDAASAVAILLEYQASGDISLVSDLASLSRDTVDMYVQSKLAVGPITPEMEVRILEHPLMQAELRHQASDLEYLESLSDIGTSSLAALRLRLRARRSLGTVEAADCMDENVLPLR